MPRSVNIIPKGRSGPRSYEAPKRQPFSISETGRYAQSSPRRAKTTAFSSPVATGLNAPSGTTAKPFASVTKGAPGDWPGRWIRTLAPSTGAPLPKRVTHTRDPCGDTFALMARSVTCAITPSDTMRARWLPGRSV